MENMIKETSKVRLKAFNSIDKKGTEKESTVNGKDGSRIHDNSTILGSNYLDN